MASQDQEANLDQIAAKAMERMEDMISLMERAAYQVASGYRLEDVKVGEYELYVASKAMGKEQSIVCIWNSEDYFELLSSAASEMGVSLENTDELEVCLPEAEFGEGMVTGGFQTWKGISVDLRNDPMEELLEAVCQKLRERGLAVSCASEVDVIFSMSIKKYD